jgi:hypothetical protein
MIPLVSYIFVCAATAYVCTAVKEDAPDTLAFATLRLLVVLAVGIAAFGAVIQIFTLLAG